MSNDVGRLRFQAAAEEGLGSVGTKITWFEYGSWGARRSQGRWEISTDVSGPFIHNHQQKQINFIARNGCVSRDVSETVYLIRGGRISSSFMIGGFRPFPHPLSPSCPSPLPTSYHLNSLTPSETQAKVKRDSKTLI